MFECMQNEIMGTGQGVSNEKLTLLLKGATVCIEVRWKCSNRTVSQFTLF